MNRITALSMIEVSEGWMNEETIKGSEITNSDGIESSTNMIKSFEGKDVQNCAISVKSFSSKKETEKGSNSVVQ